jgi:hypothetical protein
VALAGLAALPGLASRLGLGARLGRAAQLGLGALLLSVLLGPTPGATAMAPAPGAAVLSGAAPVAPPAGTLAPGAAPVAPGAVTVSPVATPSVPGAVTVAPQAATLGPATGVRAIAVADQDPAMFTDPAWLALGIAEARVVAPWSLAGGARDQRAARWLDAARRAGVDALVSWQPAGGRLPSGPAFAAAFRAFRRRWPAVHEFATWNEPNIPGLRTAAHPGLLVGYWRTMRRVCPACTVLAPELIDFPDAPAWARRFEAAARAHGIAWGLHDYQDVNHFRPLARTVTARLLRAVTGPVWLTETGGLVAFRNFPYDEARADRATVRTLAVAARGGRRIPRVYLYNWQARPGARWDSGLLGPGGRPRPAYWSLAGALGRTAAARAAVAGR